MAKESGWRMRVNANNIINFMSKKAPGTSIVIHQSLPTPNTHEKNFITVPAGLTQWRIAPKGKWSRAGTLLCENCGGDLVSDLWMTLEWRNERMSSKFEVFERTNLIRETTGSGSFASCSSMQTAVPSRLHGWHESKLSFVSCTELFRKKSFIFVSCIWGWCRSRRGHVLACRVSRRGTSRGCTRRHIQVTTTGSATARPALQWHDTREEFCAQWCAVMSCGRCHLPRVAASAAADAFSATRHLHATARHRTTLGINRRPAADWIPNNGHGNMSRKFESFERINSIPETKGNFDSRNSCKRLEISRLHELHESKFPFVSRIEFIRSKLSNFSAHISGVNVHSDERVDCPLQMLIGR